MTKDINILWADDEIDLLKPHIVFLESKGYKVFTVTNGNDAIQTIENTSIDLILLDENMPGKSGLEVLNVLKQIKPEVPVVMITKSEEENIMDDAIGAKINDYLIKPVNPNQILLIIKKHIENKQLIASKVTSAFQNKFIELNQQIQYANSIDDWYNVYKSIVFWELQLTNVEQQLAEVILAQKNEANNAFGKFIKKNYSSWFNPSNSNKPILSNSLFAKKIFPLLENQQKVLLIVIDNLRFDQWKFLSSSIAEIAKIENEELYCSILPTSTQYARNAMFSGLMPYEIYKLFPEYWKFDDEEDSKNLFENELLKYQMKRCGKKINYHYNKINNQREAKHFFDILPGLKQFDFLVSVFNFVDILSHARTQTEVIKELVSDESSYRSVTLSWFQHSILPDTIQWATNNGMKVVITTDHGTVKVTNPIKVLGDRDTSTNLRYKMGKNLKYDRSEVFEVRKPAEMHLPSSNLTSTYIFALNSDYFVYPNNYNYFVNYYKNTFQHGGISMEEMLIPYIELARK